MNQSILHRWRLEGMAQSVVPVPTVRVAGRPAGSIAARAGDGIGVERSGVAADPPVQRQCDATEQDKTVAEGRLQIARAEADQCADQPTTNENDCAAGRG